MDRLNRSLGELEMPWPMSRDELLDAMMQLIEVNESREGFMYLQITRGERDRNYLYDGDFVPNVFAFTQKEKFAADAPPLGPCRAQKGIFNYYHFHHPVFMLVVQITFSLLFSLLFRATGVISFPIERRHLRCAPPSSASCR